MVIAVDCHGGDYAPQEVVRGAIAAAEEYKVDIALVGMKAILHMLVKQYTKKKSSITILEASQTIDFNEDPFQAVQSKPDSSIAVGTKLVRDGIASGFVSAGNSGAVVVASFLNLGKIEGVKRAAICAVINMNKTNPVLIIDVGANADCQPSFLVEFAQLATVFAKEVLGIASPGLDY